MSINNTISNLDLVNITKTKLSSADVTYNNEESFDLTWNDILYDGGLATWLTRSSFRWLTISVCLIGIIGKFDLIFVIKLLDIKIYLNQVIY
jgi:hypothetical protein